MCLIECNQPVYPLDIVRTMRDQRAMMIQTPVSTTRMSVHSQRDGFCYQYIFQTILFSF